MFRTKLTLQALASAIAQSITRANEMLEADHKNAVQQYKNNYNGMAPPPPPLMIRSVKVKVNGNISRGDEEKDIQELTVDLGKANGNFVAEMEFMPFYDEIIRALKEKERPG